MLISRHNARIIEVNETYTAIQKAGTTEETTALYDDLEQIGILQFVRSGRIAVTKSHVEKLNEYLAYREAQYKLLENKNGE